MADGIDPTAGAPAPIEPVAATPIAPAPAPVAEVSALAPAELIAPAPEVAPVVEPAPEVPAEPAPAELTPIEVAPEPAAEGEKPAEEVKPEPPPAPVYADFKLPEGVSVTPEQIAPFTDILGKHGISQEVGQELMDLHANALKQAAEATTQGQFDTFEQTRRTWREDFFKSAGNRSDTIANDAKQAIKDLVPDTAKRTELYEVLKFTGAGDHKAVINLLAAAGRKLRERAAPPQGVRMSGQSKSAADRRYDSAPKR